MNIRGIEYYDIIDWGGGTTNRSAKTYLEYSPWVVDGNNLYAYEGLYIHSLACKYTLFNGNDIWVNFKFRYITKKDNSYAYAGNINGILIFSPHKNTNGQSYIIDEKIYTNSTALKNSYTLIPVFSANDNSTLNKHGAYNLISNMNDNGIKAGSLSALSVYNTFSVHIVNNTFTYYMNGNYLGATSTTNYKSFVIGYGVGSTSMDTTCIYNSIQSITLTNQMSLEVPQPPYTLDNKNNDMYGYEKISTE